MVRLALTCLSPAVVLSLTTLASAQSSGAIRLDTELRERIATFERAKILADEKAVRLFDKLITSAKTSKAVKEAVRAELIEKCVTARTRFIKTGEWSDDPALALALEEYHYNQSIAKSFAPVSKAFDQTLKTYRDKNDTKSVTRVLSERAKLVAAHFPGRESFTVDSTWVGNRIGSKGGSNAMQMRLTAVNDITFEAEIHQDPMFVNHPIFEVTGYLDGNRLVISTSKQTGGSAQNLNFSGYVSTGRMFLDIEIVAKKGKPTNDYAILQQQVVKKR